LTGRYEAAGSFIAASVGLCTFGSHRLVRLEPVISEGVLYG
jgi:hypothetical protein